MVERVAYNQAHFVQVRDATLPNGICNRFHYPYPWRLHPFLCLWIPPIKMQNRFSSSALSGLHAPDRLKESLIFSLFACTRLCVRIYGSFLPTFARHELA